MSRVIKFRAWNKLAKKMAVIDALDFMLDSYRAHAGELSGSGHLADIDLMQFTGLLDKHGTEIYEGDICRLFYSDGSSEEQPAQIKHGLHKVGFDSDCATTGPAFGWYFSPYPALYGNMGIGEHFNWENPQYLEVIGNIYENPELVEQGKEEAWDE